MGRRRCYALAMAGLLCMLPVFSGQNARAEEPLIACEKVGATKAECLLTAIAPIDAKSVAAQVAGEPVKDIAFDAYRPDADPVYWQFLVDTSDPGRRDAVRAAADAIADIAAAGNSKQVFGLSVFSDQLKTLVAAPADAEAVIAGAKTMRASGPATELFAYAHDMLGEMAKVDARRKILVILSDGKTEDTGYSYEDVVKRAKALGITIFAIGYPERAADSPDLQSLRRMSEETNGLFVSAEAGRFAVKDTLADSVYGMLSGTAYLTLKYSAIDSVSPLLVTGKVDGDDFSVRTSLDPSGSGAANTGIVARWNDLMARIGASFGLGARQMSFVAVLVLAIVLLMLAVLVINILAKRKRRNVAAAQEEEEERLRRNAEMAAMAESVEGPLLALLRYDLDGNVYETEVRKRVFTIGRHSENDLCLSSDDPATDGISRVHATISLTPDNRFMVRDMGALNKTFVNSEQIESRKLANGDILSLGAFSLRFWQAGDDGQDDEFQAQ